MSPAGVTLGTLLWLAIFIVCLSDGTATTANTPLVSAKGYLTPSAKTRLKQVFDVALKDLKDLGSIHYSVLGYSLLNEVIQQSQEICSKLSDAAKELEGVQPLPLESYYYISSTWNILKRCSGSFLPKDITKTLLTTLDDIEASLAGGGKKTLIDLYHLIGMLESFDEGQKALQKQQTTDKVIKIIEAALKKDDSIPNVGYALHIAAWLGVKGQFAFDRIEDAVVQADEVDGKYLQFEGGLSITGLVVSGAYRLSAAVNKRPPLTGDQLVKFANYLLSRSSVQTPKGAATLLNAIMHLANNKFEQVVVVTMIGDRSVSAEEGKGKLEVLVSDVLGRPLPESTISQVIIDPAPLTSAEIMPSKNKFQQSSTNKSLYSIALIESGKKVEPGIYKVSVSVVAAPPPSPTPTAKGSSSPAPASQQTPTPVANTGILLSVKVMATIVPSNVQIGTGDADQTTQPKFYGVTYPGKLDTILEVDSLQKMVIKFSVKDKWSEKSIAVHQAFVRLSHRTTQQELIFVTDVDSTNNYRLDLDIGAKAQELGTLSGVYKVELLIGDVVVANSVSWHVADIRLKLMAPEPPSSAEGMLSHHHHIYTPKPEIKHLFREPEKRPPVFVSNLFTALVLVPLIVLFGLWLKLGVNISNFPFSLSAIGFHLGLGAIFGLFGMFWLKLNMFETLKCLMGLGVVTFLCGNKMLATIASNRSKH